ncbi:MAG: HAMP domain-containing protein, partial [Synergistaceae bacterium]|nr:HAMP domain-containing protein [Synergistaceae bacterium]
MRTLGKKISALVLVTLLVGTLLSWLLVSGDLKTRLNEEVSDQLSTDTRAVVQLLQEKGVASLSSSLESWSRILGVRITLIDGDGSVLADSTISPDQLSQVDNHLTRPEIHQALEAGSGRDLRYSESTRERYLYYAVRTMIGDRPIVVRCSLLYSQFDQILWRVRRHLVLSLCIAGFFSMLLGSLWARRLTHPLEKLTLAAGALERGERAAFPDSGGTEIERLSLSMKNMAERLEATVADLQEEREQLRTVVEAMPVGLLLLDSAGRVRYANGVLHALLRDLPERLEGESIQGAIRIP